MEHLADLATLPRERMVVTGKTEQFQEAQLHTLHSGLSKFLQVKVKDLGFADTPITFAHLCRMCLPLLTSSLMNRNPAAPRPPCPEPR